jgi:hypothetical protein
MFVAINDRRSNQSPSFLLLLLGDVRLACVSKLGKGMLLHVIEHASHHFGFMNI